MSRKARLTVFRDKLEAISDCPSTIFNELEASDRLLELIKNAESHDLLAIREIIMYLHKVLCENNRPSDAMLYFLKLGLKVKDATSVIFLLDYIATFNTAFELIDEAIDVLKSNGREEEADSTIIMARTKRLLATPSADCDFEVLNKELNDLELSLFFDITMYLAAKELEFKGTPISDQVRRYASTSAFEELLILPTFTGEGDIRTAPTPKMKNFHCEALAKAPSRFNIGMWKDFWLKVMYEYAMTYLEGDLSVFVPSMLSVVSSRPVYAEQHLDELALKKYALDHGLDGYSEEECDSLELKCRFNGLNFTASYGEHIKEAIYTRVLGDSAQQSAVFDAEVQHERNRYRLSMVLTNHKKRAARHQWDGVIAIRSDEDVPPLFEPIPIVEMNAEISRNGIKLAKEKKVSQVLCEGEIRLGDKVSPLEVDLILDISYVSATKCTHCGIKIERFKRQGEYLLLQTDITLYAKDS